MSLLCLVIVGKENEPLYQRDFDPRENKDPAAAVSDDEAGDCFGFASAMRSTESTISLRHEVSLIMGLDCIRSSQTLLSYPFLPSLSVHDALGA